MKRIRTGHWVALLLVAFVAATAGRVVTVFRRAAGAVDRPNLVLITIDTLRADHLGAYGYSRDTSPHIDALAAGGALFDYAAVQWPKTNPSMASMMTSTYCTTNAVRNYGAPIDRRLMTLARIMDEAGYYCASFVANAHLGRFFNFDEGFDEVHELWARTESAHPMGLNYVGTYGNAEIAERVTQWIGKRGKGPFFLWVHLLDPHGPYEPPADLAGAYTGDELYSSQDRGVAWGKIPPYQKPTRKKVNRLADFVARYDAEIADSDRTVGRILEALDVGGLTSETLVVLTADHGESLGERGYYFDHGEYLYDSCLRVPLVVSRPGRIPAGGRIATPVALIDLLPTLLELLEVDASDYEAGFQGHSFAALLRGEEMPERAIFSECKTQQSSVRRGKWKLIDDPRADEQTGKVELRLFDLDNDPMETRNVAEEYAEVRGRLADELSAWKRELEETIGEYRRESIDQEQLSAELREWIRTMGYSVDDEESDPDGR